MRSQISRIFFVFCLFLFPFFSFGKDPVEPGEIEIIGEDKKNFMDETSRILGKDIGFRTRFVQERHLSVFMDTLVTEGVCFFQKPALLRWETTSPYRSILIYNKKQIAKFDFYNGKLRKLLSNSSDIMAVVLGEIAYWMKGDFNKSDIYNVKIFKGTNFRLVLIPKSEDLKKTISRIEIILDAASRHVVSVLIHEFSGDYIKIKYFDDRHNLSFDNAFDLVNPSIEIHPESGE